MSERIIKVNGEPARFRRTRIFVHDVIFLAKDISECQPVIEQFPKLTLEDLRAAFAYYKKHKEEVLQSIEDDIPF